MMLTFGVILARPTIGLGEPTTRSKFLVNEVADLFLFGVSQSPIQH
jgi:hypothetical protein